MTKVISFPIEPIILKYARKNAGYSLEEVSQKTKISTDKLSSYELSKQEIPFNQISKLSNLYKRSIAYFLLPKIPEDVVLPKDFRIVYESKSHQFSPKFYLSVRRARYIQSSLNELWEGEIDYKFTPTDLSKNIEDLSIWFRKRINLDFESQKKWSNSDVAYKKWKNILEEQNIFILQMNLSYDDVSAYCLSDKKPYIVVINSHDHVNRKIFSLIHEVGHLLLGKSGVCNPDELDNNSKKYSIVEKFCNQFASAVLLPKNDFLGLREVQSLIQDTYKNWNMSYIQSIARQYKISEEVVVRRMLTLGFIRNDDYEDWRANYKESFKDYEKPKRTNIKIPQHIKCISQNGRAFTSFVLYQYGLKRITYNTVADLLNISPKYITSVQQYI